MRLHSCSKQITIATLLILGSSLAKAADVEFGNPPTGGNGFPFNFGALPPSDRYQQIYNSSAFSGPSLIDSITFFDSDLDASFREADYLISLSTSPKAVNGLDTSNFDNNVGADNATFLSIHLSGATGSSYTFDGTDFSYNPALGNLLIDIKVSNVSGGGGGFMDARNGDFGTDSSRAHNFGTAFESYGLRTRFSLTTASVPDAGSTVSLLALSLPVFGMIRRKLTH